MNDTTHDWLIGWITYSKAVELYEAGWLGPREALPAEDNARRNHLIARDMRERFPSIKSASPPAPTVPMTPAEKADLDHLNNFQAALNRMNEARRAAASKILRNLLVSGAITAQLIHRRTGQRFTLPGHFWMSDEAANAITAADCEFYFERYLARGPVLISETDVREKAKAATATAPKLPVARTALQLSKAQEVAREFILAQKDRGLKVTQDEVRDHVLSKNLHVADADPGVWWKAFAADPETKGLIQGRGRRRKNPGENPEKKSRR